MGRSLHRSLLRLALMAGLAVAGLAPAALAQSTSYKLLDNASASGAPFFPQSGNYLLHIGGTFAGATLTLTMTQNSGGATTTLGTWTSAPGTDPCIVIPAGVALQMTVAGGSPHNLYANLGGVGAGGCPVAGSGGVDPVGLKNAAGDAINPATTSTDTNTGAISTTLGAKTDAKSTATDGTSVSAMQVLKQLSASLQALVTSVATTSTDTNTGAVSTAIGSKTDAKSTATDTTSVSAMQVLKQISSSVQAAATASNQGTANTSLGTIATNTGTGATNSATIATNTGAASTTLGSKTDAKSTATDATSISAMQVLKQLSSSLQTLEAAAGSAQPAACTGVIPISQTASTDIKTLTNKGQICGIVLVSPDAENISLVQGTGTMCATGIAALMGGTTAANGMPLSANGGFSAVSVAPWLVMTTTAQHLCLLQSGSGRVAGVITYVDK